MLKELLQKDNYNILNFSTTYFSFDVIWTYKIWGYNNKIVCGISNNFTLV